MGKRRDDGRAPSRRQRCPTPGPAPSPARWSRSSDHPCRGAPRRTTASSRGVCRSRTTRGSSRRCGRRAPCRSRHRPAAVLLIRSRRPASAAPLSCPALFPMCCYYLHIQMLVPRVGHLRNSAYQRVKHGQPDDAQRRRYVAPHGASAGPATATPPRSQTGQATPYGRDTYYP